MCREWEGVKDTLETGLHLPGNWISSPLGVRKANFIVYKQNDLQYLLMHSEQTKISVVHDPMHTLIFVFMWLTQPHSYMSSQS